MSTSKVNVPVDLEWPVQFGQKIDGDLYRFTLEENDLKGCPTAHLGVEKNGSEVFVGRPLIPGTPIGLTLVDLPVMFYPLNDGEGTVRPTEQSIRDEDVELFATTKP